MSHWPASMVTAHGTRPSTLYQAPTGTSYSVVISDGSNTPVSPLTWVTRLTKWYGGSGSRQRRG